MRNFQQNKKWLSVIESKPVLILLSILLIFFSWVIVGIFNKMQTTIENKRVAENRFKELQNKKEIFSADVAQLSTESGIESSIRDKFPVAKEGEGLIVVVEDKNKINEKKEEKPSWFRSLFTVWFK